MRARLQFSASTIGSLPQDASGSSSPHLAKLLMALGKSVPARSTISWVMPVSSVKNAESAGFRTGLTRTAKASPSSARVAPFTRMAPIWTISRCSFGPVHFRSSTPSQAVYSVSNRINCAGSSGNSMLFPPAFQVRDDGTRPAVSFLFRHVEMCCHEVDRFLDHFLERKVGLGEFPVLVAGRAVFWRRITIPFASAVFFAEDDAAALAAGPVVFCIGHGFAMRRPPQRFISTHRMFFGDRERRYVRMIFFISMNCSFVSSPFARRSSRTARAFPPPRSLPRSQRNRNTTPMITSAHQTNMIGEKAYPHPFQPIMGYPPYREDIPNTPFPSPAAPPDIIIGPKPWPEENAAFGSHPEMRLPMTTCIASSPSSPWARSSIAFIAAWASPIMSPMKYSPRAPKSSSVRLAHEACFAWIFSQTAFPSASSIAVWSSVSFVMPVPIIVAAPAGSATVRAIRNTDIVKVFCSIGVLSLNYDVSLVTR